MADPNNIRLGGDASELVTALEKASKAFTNFDTASSRVEKNISKFDKSGKILSQTIGLVDQFGNKIVGSFKLVDDVFQLTTRTLNANVKSLEQQKEAVRQAGLEADKQTRNLEKFRDAAARAFAPVDIELAKQQAIDAIRSGGGIDTTRIPDKNVGSVVSAQRALIKLAETARATGTAIAQALDRARSGALNYNNAITEVEVRAVKLAQAEKRAIEATTEALRKQREEAEKTFGEIEKTSIRFQENLRQTREEALSNKAKAAEKRFQEEQRRLSVDQTRQAIRSSGLDLTKIQDARSILAAQQSLIKLAENGKFAGDTIATSIGKARQGLINFNNASNDAELAAAKLADAEKRASDKIIASTEAERNATERLLSAKAKLAESRFQQEQRTSEANQTRQLIRTGGPDRTGVSQTTVNAIANAERGLVKLAETGKATAREIEVSIARARSGVLNFNNAINAVEAGALRLVAAETKAIAEQAENAVAPIRNLANSIIGLAKITAISLFVGEVFRLRSALEEATSKAVDFSIALGQIDTIQTDAALSAQTWTNALRQLSDNYAIDLITQASAAYNVLSNQVAQGAEAITFLDAANKLAVTGVTDTKSAVELLTSIINAYQVPVEDAEIISAKLFKTVELGRTTVEQMAKGFGRLAVPAKTVGVSIEELFGAIAQTSIRGVEWHETSTLIRNILLKLIRPTDRMKKAFEDLGFANAESLIQAQGFVGALAAIEEEVGSTTTELGEAYGRVRALTGGLIFAGRGAEETRKKIEEIEKTTIAAFGEDTQRITETAGFKIKQAGEQAKNFFEIEFGKPLIQGIADVIDALGGMQNILRTTSDIFISVLRIGIVPFAAFLVTKAVQAVLSLRTAFAALNTTVLANPLLAIASAVTLIVTALSESIKETEQAQLKALEKANADYVDQQAKIAQVTKAYTAEITNEAVNAAKARFRAVYSEFANIRKALNDQARLHKDHADLIENEYNAINNNTNKFVTKAISNQEKLLNTSKNNAIKAAEEIAKIFEDASKSKFQLNLSAAGLEDQIAFIDERIKTFEAEASKAVTTGDLDAFQQASKNIQDLNKLRTDTLVKYSNERIGNETNIHDLILKMQDARSQKDKDLIYERIRSLQIEARLIKFGSQQELDAQRKISDAEAKVREAKTPEERVSAEEELRKVQKEQNIILRQARAELKLRRDNVGSVFKLADQLRQIESINANQARETEAQKAKYEDIQLSLKLLTEEIKEFDAEKVFASKSEDEIKQAVGEQLQLYEEILRLQREIGNATQAESILRAKGKNLLEQQQVALAKLESEAQKQRVADADALFVHQIKNLKKLEGEASIKNLKAVMENLTSIQSRFKPILDEQPPQVNRHTDPRLIAQFEQIRPLQEFLKRVDPLINYIRTLVTQQRADPTQQRGQEIFDASRVLSTLILSQPKEVRESAIVKDLTAQFNNIKAAGDSALNLALGSDLVRLAEAEHARIIAENTNIQKHNTEQVGHVASASFDMAIRVNDVSSALLELEHQLKNIKRPGFATGGMVRGPGGIDRVPIMATAGEYIVNRKQTAKFLPQLMAINHGRAIPRYNDGGIVENINFGGFSVNEAKNPQLTAREIQRVVDRGIRMRTIRRGR